jgi:hypothetical protein
LQHIDALADRDTDARADADRDRDTGTDAVGDRECNSFAYNRTDDDTVRDTQSDAVGRKRTAESRSCRRRIVRIDGDDWACRVDLARLLELVLARALPKTTPAPPLDRSDNLTTITRT